jgi:hypothetical protein
MAVRPSPTSPDIDQAEWKETCQNACNGIIGATRFYIEIPILLFGEWSIVVLVTDLVTTSRRYLSIVCQPSHSN